MTRDFIEEFMRAGKATCIGTYVIKEDDDGYYVDVRGSLYFNYTEQKKIPVRFGTVTSIFTSIGGCLTTLENSPRFVNNFL